MNDRRAVRLTVTFNDGSTEDFNTFIASVAEGLIPSGKDVDGEILYTASEKLTTKGITHVAATPDVIVALVMTLQRLILSMVEGMPPEVAPDFLKALLSLSSK